DEGYEAMAERMLALVETQDGFLGATSVRDPDTGLGITVSYWRDEPAARQWKQVAEHLVAQREGRRRWYARYRVEVCTVLRQYDHDVTVLDR
ncbi:MAG: antibiotic biosynthesis monooxygenase family protein, partial [Algiphilus sp.]